MNTQWGDFKVASPYDDTPDAVVASEDELNHVIQTQNVPVERFNGAMRYAETPLTLDEKDQVFFEALKRAVDNGWEGWGEYVNDATTKGMEAEQVIKEMKKKKTDPRTILFDHSFAKALWGDKFTNKLKEAISAPDLMIYMKENI